MFRRPFTLRHCLKRLSSNPFGHPLVEQSSVASSCRHIFNPNWASLSAMDSSKCYSNSALNSDSVFFNGLYPERGEVKKFFLELARQVESESIDLQELQDNKMFQDLCEDLKLSLSSELFSYRYSLLDLSQLTQSLKKLGIKDNTELIESIEKSLFMQISESDLFSLIECFKIFVRIDTTSLRAQILQELALAIETKLDHLTDFNEITRVYKLLNPSFPSSIMNTLDSKTMSLFTSQVPTDVYHLLKLIILVMEQKRRPTPFLKTIYGALKQSNLSNYPEPGHLVNVICAINSLNFPDGEVLEKLGEALVEKENWISQVKPASISALMVAMGKMNWKFAPIFNSFITDVEKRNFHRSQQLASFIFAAAKVDYKSENLKDIIKLNILPEIQENLKPLKQPILWLDLVWSLVILDAVSPDLINSVLNSEFLKELESLGIPEAEFARWKLLNIQSKAKMLQIPVEEAIDFSFFKPPPRTIQSKQHSSFVIDHLKNFIVRDKLMATSLESTVGVYVDAEFIIDKNFKALPIEEFGMHYKPIKDIPHDFKRISVIAAGFKDTVLDQPHPIGPLRFAWEALKNCETEPVFLTHLEMNSLVTTIERVRCLRKKFEEIFT